MKYLYILVTALLLSLTAHAQKTGWKEFDTFHDLSSKTLHPAIAGDLKLIKQNSGKLLADAINWQTSKAPKGSDIPKVKDDLDILVKECTELDNAIKTNKPDAEIQALADKAHKTFHVLFSECLIDK